MTIENLSQKSRDYKFSEQELTLIRGHIPKSKFKCLYAFYKKKSSKNAYIGFLLDRMPYMWRKSGVFSHWDVFCSRDISDLEHEEELHNFGCNNRRFTLWLYRDIEALVTEDAKYGVVTPADFVNECKRKGYAEKQELRSNKLPGQLQLDFPQLQ